MPSTTGYTATERLILDALSDCGPHHPDELCRCLPRSVYRRRATLQCHIASLRRKLPVCEAILFVTRNDWPYYIHVGLRTPGCLDTSELSHQG